MRTNAGIAIIHHKALAVIIIAALPADESVGAFSLRRRHAVQRTVRSALQRRKIFNDLDIDHLLSIGLRPFVQVI